MDHAVLRETLDTGELIYCGMAAREKERHKAGRNEMTPLNRLRYRYLSGARSDSLYPRDLTAMIASSSSGILIFSRRICTSTVLVVP